MKRVAAAASILLFLHGAQAEERNPFESNEEAIRIGASLFANRCADCHGPDAKGRLGPDLTRRWVRGESDESAFRIIRNGVPGSSMPPSSASDTELWAIVAHLRSISVMPPLETTGNPDRGLARFEEECSGCHQVRGRGGALGPDLTAIGSARSREALTTALREPSAVVALGFRAAKFRAGGELVEGAVKGEDAFSLQVMTVDSELRAFPKRGLAELDRSAKSLMPVFDEGKLSDAELEDLLAYLGTLRGAQRNP
jgi:putative heme-binding domain-containing protein